MDSIKVTHYDRTDHKEVCRIFADGISEHVKNGIKVTVTDKRILIGNVIGFLIGSYFSWNTGLSLVIGVILVQCTCVYIVYNLYVW